ncbi:hypothetical protein M409DRAFT_60283 [Zasmidium cellare ATCC 36951]|uniref:Ubiquitin-like protease family profile domain-containing protein n=1 Tax=Zasmidium cellare ATCC 36951 TaxID=1080233 RepID=A0A6A6C1J0_ZASCE|nr:uncharacterized protein M409DRAFT_60283 [Zasmidium cellare ATCC 36951]KAF2160020.1 hypothetical protein M409DRAFT_60283 [Zasmidium cellare ATCC 36951]
MAAEPTLPIDRDIQRQFAQLEQESGDVLPRYYELYQHFVDRHGLLPLGRIEHYLPKSLQLSIWALAEHQLSSGTANMVRALCRDPAAKSEMKRRNGAWALGLADVVGLFHTGRGGLTRDLAEALLAADKARCDLDQFVAALVDCAEQRRKAHDQHSKRRAEKDRTPALRFVAADARNALKALPAHDIHDEQQGEEQPEVHGNGHGALSGRRDEDAQDGERHVGQEEEEPQIAHKDEHDGEREGTQHQPAREHEPEHEPEQDESQSERASGQGTGGRDRLDEMELELEQDNASAAGSRLWHDTRADIDDGYDADGQEWGPGEEWNENEQSQADSPPIETGRRRQPSLSSVPSPDHFPALERSPPSSNISRKRTHDEFDTGTPTLPPRSKLPRLSPPIEVQEEEAESEIAMDDESSHDATVPFSLVATQTQVPAQALPPGGPAWRRILDSLSEESATAFSAPQSWAKADAVDFLLAALVPPEFHVVNSSASLPTAHARYRLCDSAGTKDPPPMVIPMSNDTHWVVAILSPAIHKATIFDSIPSSRDSSWEERLCAFYKRLPDRSQTHLRIEYALSAPEQHNEFSCCIYAVLNALTQTTGLSLQRIDDAVARTLLGSVIAARTAPPAAISDLPADLRCPVPSEATPPTDEQTASSHLARLKNNVKLAKRQYKELKRALQDFKGREQVVRYTCGIVELLFRRLDENLERHQHREDKIVAAISRIQSLDAEERLVLDELSSQPFGDFDKIKLDRWEHEREKTMQLRRILRCSIEAARTMNANLDTEFDKASAELSSLSA